MSVAKTQDVVEFNPSNIPVLKALLDKLSHDALTFRFTDVTPTTNTVTFHEIVIFDDATTRRAYLKTGKGTLAYVTLTV